MDTWTEEHKKICVEEPIHKNQNNDSTENHVDK